MVDVKRKVFRSSKMMLDLDKEKNLDLLQMSLPILYIYVPTAIVITYKCITKVKGRYYTRGCPEL